MTPTEAATPKPGQHRQFSFLQRNPGLVPPLGLLVPLVVLILLISVVNPVFLDGRNIFNVFRQISIFLILGTGMTIVMAARGIDLSVGSNVALAGCTAGFILKSDLAGDTALSIIAVLAAIGVGALVGLVNGLAVTRLKVPPLIVTLGTLTAVRGWPIWSWDPTRSVIFPTPSFGSGRDRCSGCLPQGSSRSACCCWGRS